MRIFGEKEALDDPEINRSQLFWPEHFMSPLIFCDSHFSLLLPSAAIDFEIEETLKPLHL